MSDFLKARIAPSTTTSVVNIDADGFSWNQATLAIVHIDSNDTSTLVARNTATTFPVTLEATGTWSISASDRYYAVLYEGNPTDTQLKSDAPSGQGGMPPTGWGTGIVMNISGGIFGIHDGFQGNNLLALGARTMSSDTPDDVKTNWVFPSPTTSDHLDIVIYRTEDEVPSGSGSCLAAWTESRYIVAALSWAMVGDYALATANLDALDEGSGFGSLDYIGLSLQTDEHVKGRFRSDLEQGVESGETITGFGPNPPSFIVTWDSNEAFVLAGTS